ncbi:CLUMA_CG017372, isoform A [Clunio marinus]|uniref:CLUMA_CG017372, isoform A n=1 Tax=Clunio marinus TaxID=568069 RepID=A0A1J1IX44_9DIPT|nr:CLUMA_CG017372, isoform A [Clunio marinus]
MDLSLDELIKKNKKSKNLGSRKKLTTKPGAKKEVNIKGKPGLKAKTQSPKGPKTLLDARSKIIQKKRHKIRDARDIIAQNAKKSIRDARELLSTSKKSPVTRTGARPAKKVSIPRSRPNHPVRQLSNLMMVDDLDLNELQLKPTGNLKRTVHNEFASIPPTMPKLPSFSITQELPRLSPDPFDCYVVPTRRPVPVAPLRTERIERFQPGRIMSAHMDAYEPRKSILRPSQLDEHDDRFESDRYFSSSSDGVRSRLYNDRDRNESAGIFAKLPVRGTSPPQAQIGHRIIISNLHTSVTESDVCELFEDVGPLVSAHMVRPGIAEVVYKNLGDAEEAVETYHNRQLDGQPMKCMLVRSSAKPAYSRLDDYAPARLVKKM